MQSGSCAPPWSAGPGTDDRVSFSWRVLSSCFHVYLSLWTPTARRKNNNCRVTTHDSRATSEEGFLVMVKIQCSHLLRKYLRPGLPLHLVSVLERKRSYMTKITEGGGGQKSQKRAIRFRVLSLSSDLLPPSLTPGLCPPLLARGACLPSTRRNLPFPFCQGYCYGSVLPIRLARTLPAGKGRATAFLSSLLFLF